MKLSYNWLKDFIDLSDTKLEDLVEKLTMGAFEVEEATALGAKLGDDIVLGEIKEIAKHPDADKLQITQTCIGYNADNSENIQQIVCGATNIAVGQKVPVATIGATVVKRQNISKSLSEKLPDARHASSENAELTKTSMSSLRNEHNNADGTSQTGSTFQIKKSKIRGVESCGMLCSPDELGLSEAAVKVIKEKQGDGIYILTTELRLGSPISKVLNLEPDYVLEVGARSNRGDALSVLGQAREISALLDKDLKFNLGQTKIEHDDNVISIEPRIADDARKDCSLFYTVAIQGIEIKESPTWLQERINAMGTKSINNVVDISNYVLLELGQPMHFYDREKINGDYLEVRRARAGETLTTLEEKAYELNETNLVIADTKGPSSLAGVMGGLDSSINEQTKNIVIEVAIFNSATVRKSARAAGIESESKRRFERGVDKSFSKLALLRALELLVKLAAKEGSKLKIGKILVAGSEDIAEKTVTLRDGQVKRLLGIEIARETSVKLLGRLGVKLIKEGQGTLEFSIPSWRQVDISREADLIEEIGRLYGFNNIPMQIPQTSVKTLQEQIKTKEAIMEAFIASGFSEARLSSLIGDSLIVLDSLSPELIKSKSAQAAYIEMDHPLSREHRLLRKSILPGLIQAASRNYAYDKSIDIKLFEIGKTYYFKDSAIEESKLAAILVKVEPDWTQAKPKTMAEDFFYFKSIIENLYPRVKFSSIKNSNISLIHPGISALVQQDGQSIGLIAKLHPSITKEWDLPDESYVMELDHPKLQDVKFKPIASTPIVERDITVDSSDDIDVQVIQDLMKKKLSKDLREVKLVSLFRRSVKEATDTKPKSSTFRLKFQSDTETLSGELIDQDVEKLKQSLEKELGVGFRA